MIIFSQHPTVGVNEFHAEVVVDDSGRRDETMIIFGRTLLLRAFRSEDLNWAQTTIVNKLLRSFILEPDPVASPWNSRLRLYSHPQQISLGQVGLIIDVAMVGGIPVIDMQGGFETNSGSLKVMPLMHWELHPGAKGYLEQYDLNRFPVEATRHLRSTMLSAARQDHGRFEYDVVDEDDDNSKDSK